MNGVRCEDCCHWGSAEPEQGWSEPHEEPASSRPDWRCCTKSVDEQFLAADGYDGLRLWVMTSPEFGCVLFAPRPPEGG